MTERARAFRLRAGALVLTAALGSCWSVGEPVNSLEPLPPGGTHVLFVGNSLTLANDLPGTLADLAGLGGDTIRAMDVSFGGAALQDHFAFGGAMNALRMGGWQYVVLQQGPSSSDAGRQNLMYWTKFFDDSIRAAGARTALYMVWPALEDSETFDRTVESYALASQAIGALLLPVGDAWRAAWAKDSTLPLYSSDGLHPSVLGTYLAALVMYEGITRRDAHVLPLQVRVAGRTFAVPASTVQLLQDAAHETVVRYRGPPSRAGPRMP